MGGGERDVEKDLSGAYGDKKRTPSYSELQGVQC